MSSHAYYSQRLPIPATSTGTPVPGYPSASPQRPTYGATRLIPNQAGWPTHSGYGAGQFAPAAQAMQSAPPRPKATIPLTKSLFRNGGVLLLLILCSLPFWDAVELMQDFNYEYWAGRNLPVVVMTASILIIVVFVFSLEAIFSHANPESQSPQSVVMITSMFLTAYGLILVLVSQPTARVATEAHNDLLFHCDTSQGTRAVRTQYLNLLQLRTTADCAAKFSIEECEGYADLRGKKPTETEYLKSLESEMRCSGFCFSSADLALSQANVTTLAAASAANDDAYPKAEVLSRTVTPPWSKLLSPIWKPPETDAALLHQSSANGKTKYLGGTSARQEAKLQPEAASVSAQDVTSDSEHRAPVVAKNGEIYYPPTLFSNADFRVSCEGSAGRQLLYFARDTAYQGWFVGVTLIALSIVMGLWEWGSTSLK